MKIYNYHTHTYRCGHATGNEEEMIEAAIQMGMQTIGISEHVPLPHYRKHLLRSLHAIRGIKSLSSLIYAFIKNGPGMRMPYSQIEDHLETIANCKYKYKDQIEIHQGFEAEGFEEYFDYYQSLLYEHKAEYLILGHHFHKYSIHDDYFGKNNLSKKDIYQYCNDVEKAIETHLFSYIAHPDLFLVGYQDFDVDVQTVIRRICEKAKEHNIPLEINAGGMRKGLRTIKGESLYPYPNAHFWDIVSEVGNDVIIGLDAHNPLDLNETMYKQLLDFANEHHLKVIDHFDFLQGDLERFQAEYDIR